MARFDTGMPSRWAACTPSDSTDLTGAIGVRITGAGNLVIRCIGDASDASVTIAVGDNEYFPANLVRVLAATTATGLHVAYA